MDDLLRDPTQGEFEAAMADLLQTLQALNLELNGDTPSESTRDGVDDVVPRSVAYAVSEISDRLRRRNRPEAASAVDIAWNAVLAGDIDDIAAHVRLEMRARQS